MSTPGAPNLQLVLDAWPVLEWLKQKEPALTKFNWLIEEAEAMRLRFSISRINLGEIIYSIHKEPAWSDDKKHRALAVISGLDLDVVSVSDQLVDDAVALKSRYRISYADAFAAALSMELRLPLATGDHELRALERDGLIQLHWLGV